MDSGIQPPRDVLCRPLNPSRISCWRPRPVDGLSVHLRLELGVARRAERRWLGDIRPLRRARISVTRRLFLGGTDGRQCPDYIGTARLSWEFTQ